MGFIQQNIPKQCHSGQYMVIYFYIENMTFKVCDKKSKFLFLLCILTLLRYILLYKTLIKPKLIIASFIVFSSQKTKICQFGHFWPNFQNFLREGFKTKKSQSLVFNQTGGGWVLMRPPENQTAILKIYGFLKALPENQNKEPNFQ